MAVWKQIKEFQGRPLIIRNPEITDIEGIEAYKRELAMKYQGESQKVLEDLKHWNEEFITFCKQTEGDLLLIVKLEDRIIGGCSLLKDRKNKYSHKINMQVTMIEGYLNTSVGRSLLNAVIDWCNKKGIKKIHAITNANNTKEIDLYIRFKFKIEKKENIQEDQYIMGLLLQ